MRQFNIEYQDKRKLSFGEPVLAKDWNEAVDKFLERALKEAGWDSLPADSEGLASLALQELGLVVVSVRI